MERRSEHSRNQPPKDQISPLIVSIYQKQRTLSIASASVEAAVLFLLKTKKVACKEVSIHFVTKKEISTLHAEYFDDPTPTDCISFPIDPQFSLGEVFICPSVAAAYAKKHRLDPYEETTLYLIHSLLHLLGYDDIEEKDRRRMQKEEQRCLKLLKTKKLLITHKPNDKKIRSSYR